MDPGGHVRSLFIAFASDPTKRAVDILFPRSYPSGTMRGGADKEVIQLQKPFDARQGKEHKEHNI